MHFKKVYIEITNNCNLNCDFCIKNQRKNKFITKEEFAFILDSIKDYTNYIYLHVLGEPLLHPNINELINIASSKNFNINITTNGYLINRLNTDVRQINISLHSFDEKYNIKLTTYLDDIFNKIDQMPNTMFSLRLWVKNKYSDKMIRYINKRYNINITTLENTRINNHLFLNIDKEFIWPDLNNNYYSELGRCYGLIDHFGILVDGTIVPCCLDSKGIINLGNIYKDNLNEVLNSKRVLNMIEGFKSNKKCEMLCKHCKFL